jgi:PleD family two-component response regulator
MKNIQFIILIINDENVESDCVLGLEVGADDYLVKPFSNRGGSSATGSKTAAGIKLPTRMRSSPAIAPLQVARARTAK